MTDIANVRSFNGTSDEVQLDSTAYQSSAISGVTIMAIAKRDGGAGFRWLWSLEGSGTGGGEVAFGTGGATTLAIWAWAPAGGSGTISSAANYWENTMGWCVVGVTKADGASTPTFHRYRYDLTSWDHTAAGSASFDIGTPDTNALAWIGTYDGASEWFDGDIACVGVWKNTVLTTPQIETLNSSIANWQALSPDGLWLLNQTDTAQNIVDLIGDADQIAISGTSVVSDTFAFDVGGGAAAPTLRVVRSSQRW